MGRGQKIIASILWGALVLVMVGVVVGAFWPRHPALPVKFRVEPFSLVDEDGKPFSDKDLSGKAYVADLIFTNCGDVCPLMTARMAQLQRQTPRELQLVSFTVDPARDTSAVLKQYAQRNGADESRWHFLTGTEQQMFALASGLKLAAQPAEQNNPILHSDQFLLIDGRGNVRGIYSGKNLEDLQKLAADAKDLARMPNSADEQDTQR